MAESFTGRAGTVELMDIPTSDDWRSKCHVQSWLMDCPGQSPAWRHYILSAISLRDIEGQDKPAVRDTPHCTHEILVVVLDPDRHPSPDATMVQRGERYTHLWPPNVMMQVEDCTDEEVAKLVTLLAKGVAHGILPAEPMFPNPRGDQYWRKAIDQTLEHIKLGGHAYHHA